MSDYLDLNLHEDTILTKDDNILSSEIELFFQEIEIAIKMETTDVYGHYNTFCLQDYVFKQFVTESDIYRALSEHIKNNCYHAYLFDWNIEVYLQNQILIIKFYVNGAKPSEKFMKTFLIEP